MRLYGRKVLATIPHIIHPYGPLSIFEGGFLYPLFFPLEYGMFPLLGVSLSKLVI
jgi:hypothetical protein